MSRITKEESARGELAFLAYLKGKYPQYRWEHTADTNKCDPVDFKGYDSSGNVRIVVEFKMRDGRLAGGNGIINDPRPMFCNRFHKWVEIDSIYLEENKANALLGWHAKGAMALFVTQWEDKAMAFVVTPQSVAGCGYKQNGGRTQQPRGGELPDPVYLVWSHLWTVLDYLDRGAAFKSAA